MQKNLVSVGRNGGEDSCLRGGRAGAAALDGETEAVSFGSFGLCTFELLDERDIDLHLVSAAV